MPTAEPVGVRGGGAAPTREPRRFDERHPPSAATRALLPTIVGLVVALAGPFLVQFVLAPLILLIPPSPGGTVQSVAASAPAWLLLVAHLLIDLPIILITFGVLPPI